MTTPTEANVSEAACKEHGKDNCGACGPDIDVMERIRLALEHLGAFCAEHERWRMSIPVRYDDSDQLISRALRESRSELQRARAVIEDIREIAYTARKPSEEIRERLQKYEQGE